MRTLFPTSMRCLTYHHVATAANRSCRGRLSSIISQHTQQRTDRSRTSSSSPCSRELYLSDIFSHLSSVSRFLGVCISFSLLRFAFSLGAFRALTSYTHVWCCDSNPVPVTYRRCDVCQASFVADSSLRTHLRLHEAQATQGNACCIFATALAHWYMLAPCQADYDLAFSLMCVNRIRHICCVLILRYDHWRI